MASVRSPPRIRGRRAGRSQRANLGCDAGQRSRWTTSSPCRTLDRPSRTRSPRARQLLSPGWFTTFGHRDPVRTRLRDRDRRAASPVAIVNEAFVRKCMPGGERAGRRCGGGRSRQGAARRDRRWCATPCNARCASPPADDVPGHGRSRPNRPPSSRSASKRPAAVRPR